MHFRIVTTDIYDFEIEPGELGLEVDDLEGFGATVTAAMRAYPDAMTWAKDWEMVQSLDEPTHRTISAVEVDGEVIDWAGPPRLADRHAH